MGAYHDCNDDRRLGNPDQECSPRERELHVNGHCRWCGVKVEPDENGFMKDELGDVTCKIENIMIEINVPIGHMHQMVLTTEV